MRGAVIPGPEFKTRKLKGIVISSDPPESPNVLIDLENGRTRPTGDHVEIERSLSQADRRWHAGSVRRYCNGVFAESANGDF